MELKVEKITIGVHDGQPIIYVSISHPKSLNNPTIMLPRSLLPIIEKELLKNNDENKDYE